MVEGISSVLVERRCLPRIKEGLRRKLFCFWRYDHDSTGIGGERLFPEGKESPRFAKAMDMLKKSPMYSLKNLDSFHARLATVLSDKDAEILQCSHIGNEVNTPQDESDEDYSTQD